MGKFDQYNIPLKGIGTNTHSYEFELDDEFFKKIDSPEVQRGNVMVQLDVTKESELFDLSFSLEGTVQIPCDRCLDDMDQPVEHDEIIRVRLGEEYGDEEDTVIIPEGEGKINIAWFLYEFIVVSIPIKHYHHTGECNKTMMSKLKKHIIRHEDDEDDFGFDDDDSEEDITEETTDPRWDGLKDIIGNN